ncbi:MAG: hypothetical protein Q7T36_17510 [Fluviicoccus sp.]|uniref:hypothetical protein n=1 Tax=Fluviicoccus sp. TaxID=2003552 RepID=UPI00271FA2E9|nr:hypothetical protein [Fluviicoccus sp.]MDO8332266.1 hypothetical protein [Fluviicoccus sp.]
MNITSFNDLLTAARQQPEPQRLLLVFARAEMPETASAEQRQRFETRSGGYLLPTVCVDKLPEELSTFAALVEESKATGQDWDMVFLAGMSGKAGFTPGSDEAVQPLKMMVEAIEQGRVSQFLTFNKAGEPVRFL